MKKIKIYSELVYIFAQLGLTLSVAIMAAADFGVSMIVAPAYILSEKINIINIGAFSHELTFGEWSYITQGVLFIAFCIAMKKVKLTYFVSFLTCVIYGYILDMWQKIIPILNPDIVPAGSMDLWIRVVMFIVGEVFTAFSVMLFFKSYIYPQVVDLFVKGIAQKYNINQNKFKKLFDMGCLIVSVILTLALFKTFVGVELGTIIIALVNGVLIGFFSKLYDKYVETIPLFPKVAKKFEF
ncbi:MAG: hypothetical protein IKU82_02545 [Clostridia bacterium]|nr:hypothetical protein [Clostridia bacterium]